MLDIRKSRNGEKLVVKLEGRLDTTTAPKLEMDIRDSLEGITELEIDMVNLEYISSAGLRVILFAQKKLKGQGTMVIKNCNQDVLDVFNVTGFADMLQIV